MLLPVTYRPGSGSGGIRQPGQLGRALPQSLDQRGVARLLRLAAVGAVPLEVDAVDGRIGAALRERDERGGSEDMVSGVTGNTLYMVSYGGEPSGKSTGIGRDDGYEFKSELQLHLETLPYIASDLDVCVYSNTATGKYQE